MTKVIATTILLVGFLLLALLFLSGCASMSVQAGLEYGEGPVKANIRVGNKPDGKSADPIVWM